MPLSLVTGRVSQSPPVITTVRNYINSWLLWWQARIVSCERRRVSVMVLKLFSAHIPGTDTNILVHLSAQSERRWSVCFSHHAIAVTYSQLYRFNLIIFRINKCNIRYKCTLCVHVTVIIVGCWVHWDQRCPMAPIFTLYSRFHWYTNITSRYR